ncbi:hypothetical protein Syun_025241 [Stephania yunnanensis]|uniref:Isopenicillin N synthase-like Fe(2+) 2OG dioxygenase domain-containing protein n=1 Tax=Stephania yunnanensis TaxID=152371 RepID=A0AAP0ERA7_9MAGN
MVLNCYSQCPEPDLTLCMTSHSDYGFLTILLQDEAEGLQILYEGKWITVSDGAAAEQGTVADRRGSGDGMRGSGGSGRQIGDGRRGQRAERSSGGQVAMKRSGRRGQARSGGLWQAAGGRLVQQATADLQWRVADLAAGTDRQQRGWRERWQWDGGSGGICRGG